MQLLNVLYKVGSTRTNIYERNHDDALESCYTIAQSFVDPLIIDDKLKKMIEKGRDWAMHSLPLFVFEKDTKCVYIDEVTDIARMMISEKFGKGFSVIPLENMKGIDNDVTSLWLFWSPYCSNLIDQMLKYNITDYQSYWGFKDSLVKDSKIDCFDQFGVWRKSKIVERIGSQIYVRFEGWSEQKSICLDVDLDSSRIRQYKSETKHEDTSMFHVNSESRLCEDKDNVSVFAPEGMDIYLEMLNDFIVDSDYEVKIANKNTLPTINYMHKFEKFSFIKKSTNSPKSKSRNFVEKPYKRPRSARNLSISPPSKTAKKEFNLPCMHSPKIEAHAKLLNEKKQVEKIEPTTSDKAESSSKDDKNVERVKKNMITVLKQLQNEKSVDGIPDAPQLKSIDSNQYDDETFEQIDSYGSTD